MAVGMMALSGLKHVRGLMSKGQTVLLTPTRLCHSGLVSEPCLTPPVCSAAVRSFNEIPGNWKSNFGNLYRFWKTDGFKNLHHIMVENFNTFGPIYREKVGYYESVNIIQPEDGAILFKAEGRHPKRLKVEAWTAYRDYRNRKYGVLLKSGEDWRVNRVILNKEVISPKVLGNFVPLLDEVSQDFVARVFKNINNSSSGRWTTDLSHELFRFALEAVSHVLYGERLGLLQDHINPDSQEFINSITLMFKSTVPMLYIPPNLLRQLGAKVWNDHVAAWDAIFNQADKCIQNIYRTLRHSPLLDKRYPGVLASLLLQDKLSIEEIKASVTELMAGGVDTTSITLLWTLYELAKNQELQEKLRDEVQTAWIATKGDMIQMIRSVPLINGAIKETLRLYPVAVSVQRYIANDIVIQNYNIPAGTLVQFGLYAMGRNGSIFPKPEKYNPYRWLRGENHYFKSLSFGFGPRQCLGRRIAETEMQIFLIHILRNFRIEKQRYVDVKSTFELILIPEKPILLTLRPL
ncbi:cholesterol side-chain cleavage enzyme, mitochondrial [Polypterus senegalus]